MVVRFRSSSPNTGIQISARLTPELSRQFERELDIRGIRPTELIQLALTTLFETSPNQKSPPTSR